MNYLVTLDSSIDFAPQSEVVEVLQNVRTILTTRLGTVPLDRAFGLSLNSVDMPINVAKALMNAEIIEAIERHEPRAQVQSVDFEVSADDMAQGILKPKVIITMRGET